MACTVWDFLEALTKYDGSDSAHEDVIKDLNGFGHHATMKDAWCTETLMAAMHRAGGIDLIGGYAQTSGTLKKNAQKKGIWHGGTNGILPGDILVFGSSGKPNHTEANVGFYIDVAGNYNGGCGRRSYKGRSVIGYVRPKYRGMPDMTNLQIAIAAADCILDVYSSGDTRKKQLTVFGKKNAEKIQDEVDRVWNDIDKTVFDLAVYVIANHAGKGKYRRKRLGNWATAVQDKIDDIYALKGRTNAEAAQLVLQNKFGTNTIRELLLKFCGYDPAAVQKEVNKALQQPVIKNQVHKKMLFVQRNPRLPSHESIPLTQFKQKRLQLVDELAFQFGFRIFGLFWQSQEFQDVGILDNVRRRLHDTPFFRQFPHRLLILAYSEPFIKRGIELPFEFPQAPIRVFRLNFVEFPFIGIIDTHQEQVMGVAEGEFRRHCLRNLLGVNQEKLTHLLQVSLRKPLTIICSKSSRNTIFR